MNERFPHTVSIYRMRSSLNPFVNDDVKEVIYNGKCRSYSTESTYTSKNGVVISSARIIAIGNDLDPTKVLETVNTDDCIELAMGARVEYGTIIDVTPNNFGTDIIWQYARN